MDGLLVLDKPGGMTSRAAVDRALAWFPRGTRLGHTGTLDPLATGVLVLTLGQATRLAEYVQRMAKTYLATFLLDARSDTDDADGTVEALPGMGPPPDRGQVEAALRGFVGDIEQVPPAFSAAKVTGRRAYDLARRGEEVALAPRRVRVYGIDVLDHEYPRVRVQVRCGKGTYVRSLARDFGIQLGRAALVEALRRTQVGPFTDAAALPLEADAASARSAVLPLVAAVAELPQVTLGSGELARLCQGQGVPVPDGATAGDAGAAVAVLDAGRNLRAIATVAGRGRVLRPSKVLHA
jgi:tRNA pseudouridine55 synthase